MSAMNDDALKRLWQQKTFPVPSSLPDAEQIALMERKMKRFDKTIFRRDLLEVAACVLIVFWFGRELFKTQSRETALGCLVLICSGIFIACKLVISKRRMPRIDPSDSLEKATESEIRKVEVQIRLLRSVWWWYLLPIMVGVNLCFAGMNSSLMAGIAYAVAGLMLNIFLYWLNQRAVKRNLAPMKMELESLINRTPSDTNMKLSVRKTILMIIVALGASALPLLWAAQHSPERLVDGPLPSGTAQALEVIRKKFEFPALAVVVVKDGKICDRAAVGVRKSGDKTLVTTNDQFHIGSCTKSMTATLAAMFIEEGKLRWDTTIAEIFPELRGKMNKQYETVTVEQLLTHRGGAPANPPGAAWKRAWKEQGTPVEQRREFITAVLAAPPEAAPGKKTIYSNQGYAIVGAMLEKIAGKPWEDLITEKLFKPLHMDTAGFGSPGTLEKVDQPWGHLSKFIKNIPIQSDNPPAISPAGRVHCSLDDLARYTIFQMEGERDGKLLKPETFRKLHTPPKGGDYACGWVCVERGWAGGRAMMHNGSNTMWYVVMWLAPEKDFSVIVATNTGAENAFQGCDDVASAMIHKWLEE
jgi:CubicO group peptidase (beta-lactamase class C family)